MYRRRVLLMPRRCVLAGLVSPLFLIVLLQGNGADSACSNEENIAVRRGRIEIVTVNTEGFGNNHNCSWKITTESASEVVAVYLLKLQLEGGAGCPDSLSIYDSDGPEPERRLAKLCGDARGIKTFQGTGQHMYVNFVSGDNSTGSRFELLALAQRRRVTTTTTTTTTTPTPTPPRQKEYRLEKAELHVKTYLMTSRYQSGHYSYKNVQWVIQSKHGYVVQLRVVRMDLQRSSRCSENNVTVSDTDRTLLATMCNSQFNGVDFYSSGRTMYVHFTTGASQTGDGFILYFQAVWRHEAKLRYTTSRSGTTTSSPKGSGKSRISLIFVPPLLASAFLVFCVILIAIACYRKRSLRSSAQRPATSTPSPRHSQGNNGRAVYVIPGQDSHLVIPRPSFLSRLEPTRSQTLTNPAFCPDSDEPPPYSSLHTATVQVEREDPPPYSEAMIGTHPPSYKDVTGEDTPAQSVGSTSERLRMVTEVGSVDSTAVSHVPYSVSESPSVPDSRAERDTAPNDTPP